VGALGAIGQSDIKRLLALRATVEKLA
jgi:NADH:ubiquinone oxidoreductase subunit 2 (subunit N)